MTKDYKQELADLKSGLTAIENKIKNVNSHLRDRTIKLRDIQEARIDFFKRGYNFRNRELKEQQKLT